MDADEKEGREGERKGCGPLTLSPRSASVSVYRSCHKEVVYSPKYSVAGDSADFSLTSIIHNRL